MTTGAALYAHRTHYLPTGINICPQGLHYMPTRAALLPTGPVLYAHRGCIICPQGLSYMPTGPYYMSTGVVLYGHRACIICPHEIRATAPKSWNHPCWTTLWKRGEVTGPLSRSVAHKSGRSRPNRTTQLPPPNPIYKMFAKKQEVPTKLHRTTSASELNLLSVNPEAVCPDQTYPTEPNLQFFDHERGRSRPNCTTQLPPVSTICKM